MCYLRCRRICGWRFLYLISSCFRAELSPQVRSVLSMPVVARPQPPPPQDRHGFRATRTNVAKQLRHRNNSWSKNFLLFNSGPESDCRRFFTRKYKMHLKLTGDPCKKARKKYRTTLHTCQRSEQIKKLQVSTTTPTTTVAPHLNNGLSVAAVPPSPSGPRPVLLPS